MSHTAQHEFEENLNKINFCLPKDKEEQKLNMGVLYICSAIIFIFFILFSLLQLPLLWYGHANTANTVGIVVSPFESVFNQYYPQSALPCVYPTFNYYYFGTLECASNSSLYCPKGYYCDYNDDSDVLVCFSDSIECYNDCINNILSLPLLNEDVGVRIMQDSISDWSFWIAALSFVCVVPILILFASIWHPRIRNTFKTKFVLSGMWFCIIIMSLGILIGGSIFLLTTPKYLKESCFQGDVITTINNFSIIFLYQSLLFTFHCIFVLGFLLGWIGTFFCIFTCW